MLKIHFFNVAEGDSILLEYLEGKSPFRILIDTGRQFFPESIRSDGDDDDPALRARILYDTEHLNICKQWI